MSGSRRRAQKTPENAAVERISVEELARRTGTTVSNLRALQARGLLEPPDLVGRKGLYSERHQARLALLRRLQDRGYSLAAIEDLLGGWRRGAGLMEVLGLEDAVTAERSPRRVVNLASTVPAFAADPALLARAIALELVVRDGEHLVAPDAELLDRFCEHLDAGYPPSELLEEVGRLQDDAERIAQRFRGLFQRHVIAPFAAAGAPAQGLNALSEKVDRLRSGGVRTMTLLLKRALERGGAVPDALPASSVESETRPPKRSKATRSTRRKR
ncbi:MAG TPA: MerR family transcriptional regulator [Polyangiaceae bacterium]